MKPKDGQEMDKLHLSAVPRTLDILAAIGRDIQWRWPRSKRRRIRRKWAKDPNNWRAVIGYWMDVQQVQIPGAGWNGELAVERWPAGAIRARVVFWVYCHRCRYRLAGEAETHGGRLTHMQELVRCFDAELPDGWALEGDGLLVCPSCAC